MNLGFTGDVMFGRKVDEYQRRRPPEHVWGDLLDRLRGLDSLLINLECTLSTRGERWTRTYRPFHFRADPDWAVPALEAAGVDYCSLANNHMLDFEVPALEDTLDHLDNAGIAHAGAGTNEAVARDPVTFRVGDLEVVCVAFTDNTPEFAAGPNAPGVAYLDGPGRESRRIVRRVLDDARTADPDLLIASLHWGPNMVTEPDEDFQEFCRWLAEEGVDVIHGHSAHVFQGIEVYQGTPICYDMGDFVDDYRVDPDIRNDRSFLFEVIIEDGIEELRLLPVEIDDYSVHETGPEVAEWCRTRMRDLSRPFGTTFERAGEELVLEV